MKKTIWIVIFVIILAIIIKFGFYNNQAPKGNIKIGIATLLTGDYAVLGKNIVNASQLAVKEINDKGGVNNRKIELFIEDSGVTSKDGLSAVQKLINVDGVDYIVAGMSGNGTLAAAPLANQSHVILMSPVTGGKNVDEAGEYVFRNANSDILAGRDLANAMLKLGYKNVGVISETTEYTLDIKNTFEKTIKDNGGSIVVSEEFQSGTKDYRTLVKKVQTENPQAILVLSQVGTDAANFIKQSRELGFNPPLFTDFNLTTNPDVKKIIGTYDGIYFADPFFDSNSTSTKAFLDLYRVTYNAPSAIPFHALASYDAIMMFADGIREVGDNPVKVKNWLISNVKNRHGLMGVFSFDKNGNSDLGFTIKLMKGDKAEVVRF